MGASLQPLPPKAYLDLEIKISPAAGPGTVPLNIGDMAVSEYGMLIKWDGSFWQVVTDAEIVRGGAPSAHNRPPITEFSVRKLELET